MTTPPLAVVDIDGVVADVRHRLHHIERRPKDWASFFREAIDDEPHPEGIALVRKLAEDHAILFLTGRPESLRRDTETWLERHGIGGHPIEMRGRSDRRPAAHVKVERLRRLTRGRVVAVVVDDDPVVVRAMREAGYPVFHADWEQRAIANEDALRVAQEVEGRT